MHYYQFNIGDFASHTAHLEPLEEIAYRRMLDYCYLHEIGLPESVEEVARLIRMRSHSDCIAVVLREFFVQHSDGTWRSERVDREVAAFREKSNKAAQSARKRWEKGDANASKSHDGRNANQEPLTNNQEPITNTEKRTRKPALDYTNWPQQPDPQVLSDWLAMRKRLKADVSQTVINSFAKELALAAQEGVTVDQCLSECITANWRGFKFGWLKNRDAGRQPARHGEFENRDYQKGVGDDGRF